MRDIIQHELEESAAVKKLVASQLTGAIAKAAEMIIASYKTGGKLLLCGNGGSAADAQHIAGELVGRFLKERKALSAIALTTDTSILTALANDYNVEKIFARQVEAHGKSGDVLLTISTSGNSSNVIQAVEAAKAIDVKTIGLLGKGGGKMKGMCDVEIIIPSDNTQRIQEAHITIGHIICGLVEKTLFGE
ncbi:MAG: D-sedoheptulose 7-phosphate isomerase [Parcubacteria group bacterium Gr01-1014_70]|nr:MAG: D-sedoheptulose 7-phosphate isomerase [Parcubacteria group bacterium Gr01-1014_70]